MSGRRDDSCIDIADFERIAICEQVAELAAVDGEIPEVKYAFEYVLHRCDLGTDSGRPTNLVRNMRCAAKMVRVDMRFQNPVNRQIGVFDIGDQFVGRSCGRPAGVGLVVEHRIDDDCASCFGIADHVRDGEGCLVEECFYVWIAHRISRSVLSICIF